MRFNLARAAVMVRVLCCLGALCLLAAGCRSGAAAGGDDVGGASEPGAIRVGMVCGGMTPMVAQIAFQAGTFPEDLEAEKFCFDGGSEAVQALIGGSLDVFMGSIEHVVSTRKQGLETSAYAVINNRPPYSLIAKAGSEVTGVADLEGQTVAVTSPGSLSDTELHAAVDGAGVAYDSLRVTGAGSGSGMKGAIDRSVAAGMVSDPLKSEMVQDGYQLVWEPDFPLPAIVALGKTEWVDANQATMRAFLEGLTASHQQASEDSAFAVEQMKKEGFQVSDEVLTEAVGNGLESVPEGLAVDQQAYDDAVELLASVGKFEGDPPAFEEAFDFSFLPQQ